MHSEGHIFNECLTESMTNHRPVTTDKIRSVRIICISSARSHCTYMLCQCIGGMPVQLQWMAWVIFPFFPHNFPNLDFVVFNKLFPRLRLCDHTFQTFLFGSTDRLKVACSHPCISPGSPGCEPGSPAAVQAAPRRRRPGLGSSPSLAGRRRLWVTDH